MTLVVNSLTKRFDGLTAVDGLSFVAPTNQVTAIIGPNGAGKTTMLSMVSGLMKPTAGTVIFDGNDLHGLSGHQVAARGVARTYQNLQMFEDMTVLEVVMTGAHRLGKTGFLSALFRTGGTRREEVMLETAARTQLHELHVPADLYDRDAASLPYGWQRRVELARALVSRPSLLLLDEPAAGLNSAETEELSNVIADLRAGGLTVLLIEHDMDMVMRLSDLVVVMSFGKLIATGSPKHVQEHPEVIEAYLGVEDESC